MVRQLIDEEATEALEIFGGELGVEK